MKYWILDGCEVRFVEHEDKWWAVLKDICEALDVRVKKIREKIGRDYFMRLEVDGEKEWVINEAGIYHLMFYSKKAQSDRFRFWTVEVLCKLRETVGLKGYEVLRMLDDDIQQDINRILDTLYWDEERKCVMQSITVPGGDVEQISFGGL